MTDFQAFFRVLLLALVCLPPCLSGHIRHKHLHLTHLFQRYSNNTNVTYPPQDSPGPTPLPAWVSAYKVAKRLGLIPKIRPSVLSDGEPNYPFYTHSRLADSRDICSWTVAKCDPSSDIVDAPGGMMGISFDDGPQAPTASLLRFLKKNNQTATHFMIGSRIVENPKLLVRAVRDNHDHIAVHTWSHPFMTTMTDKQVLGEIGWTMQIIYDHVGLLPAFWRPPYGDIDNRIRAIASEVFGLRSVMWSSDPNDWCLSDDSSPKSDCPPGSGPQNFNELVKELKKTISNTTLNSTTQLRPGVISLEHELSVRTVAAFVDTYPLAKQLGWNTKPIPDLFNLPWYQTPNKSHSGILPIHERNITLATQPPYPVNTTTTPKPCNPNLNNQEQSIACINPPKSNPLPLNGASSPSLYNRLTKYSRLYHLVSIFLFSLLAC